MSIRKPSALLLITLVVTIFAQPLWAQVRFDVGTGRSFTSIQAAVDACPEAGCILNLTDTAYPLPREVWIEAKKNLTIQASPSLKAAKILPRLYYTGKTSEFSLAGTATDPADPLRPAGWKKWPIKGPNQKGSGSAGDSSNPYSQFGAQYNGYLVILRSSNVTIDAIAIDGIRPTTFVNIGIWDDMYDVFFGNVGINLMDSKKVTVKNCEVRNCFTAIYLRNRNPGGFFPSASSSDLATQVIPMSRHGEMGGHLIERNRLHDNWYAFYDEMEWDLGSTIRYNLCDRNFNTQFAQGKDSSSESNSMLGGFLFQKDVRITPHKIHNNTINGSSIIFGHGYQMPGVQHHFYDNLVTGWNRSGLNARMVSDNRQLLGLYNNFLYANTFEVGDADSLFAFQTLDSGIVADTSACRNAGLTAPCILAWDAPVRIPVGIKNGWLWYGWEVGKTGSYTGMHKGVLLVASSGLAIDAFGQGGIIQRAVGLGGTASDIASQQNFWVRKLPYQSTQIAEQGYLEPAWDVAVIDSTVKDKGWRSVGGTDLDGSRRDRGAISKTGENSATLTLHDQSLVNLNKLDRTVSFTYCIDASASATDLDFETVSYYKTIALSTPKNSTPSPSFPVPIQLTNIGDKPVAGTCGRFKAILPAAPVDSFARFDLVLRGTVDGATVRSNVGIWIWHQMQYRIDTYFTKSTSGRDTIESVRVGELVYMHVIGRRTDNNSAIPRIDVLTIQPDKGMALLPYNRTLLSGDTIDKNMPGIGTYGIAFGGTGTAQISLTGSIGSLVAPGEVRLKILPGLPAQVAWKTPYDWKDLDHSLPLDSIATAIEQKPVAIALQVLDSFGNPVDTATEVQLSFGKIDSQFLGIGASSLSTGPFTQTLFKSDTTGKIEGFLLANGLAGRKFWGLANVVEKTLVDSALVKLQKSSTRLLFVPNTAIDTFVNARHKVRLILSSDSSSIDSTDPRSGTMIHLATSRGSKLYATDTSTVALDSAILTNGRLDFWVTSSSPIIDDTITASSVWIESTTPTRLAPISFRMPNLPKVPSPGTGRFWDDNCDGVADRIVVPWLPAQGVSGIDTLDSAAASIAEVRVYNLTDSVSINLSAVKIASSRKGIEVALPSVAKSLFAPSAPTGKIRIFATLKRHPATDTVIDLGIASLTDGIAPRPLASVLVENPSAGILPDTLTVEFSEPVRNLGTAFPFRIFSSGMKAELDTSGILVQQVVAVTPKTLRFVLANARLADASVLAIAPGSKLTDLAGNKSNFLACETDTASISLQRVQVGALRASLHDTDSDGRPDRLRVVFRRNFHSASERPDSMTVSDWKGAATVTMPFVSADSVAPATWDLSLSAPFPSNSTAGSRDSLGHGTLRIQFGAPSLLNPPQEIVIEDSVAPIAIGIAKLSIGKTFDRIVLSFSEPMSLRDSLAKATMVRKDSLGEQSLAFSHGTPDSTTTVWSFDVSVGVLDSGDSIRLPDALHSMLSAANGTLPSCRAATPWIQVIGGHRTPDSTVVVDTSTNDSTPSILVTSPSRYKSSVFPAAEILTISKDPASNPLHAAEALSTWIQDESDAAHWNAYPPAGTSSALGSVDSATISQNLVGVRLDLGGDFDGEFYVYDQLGTFVVRKKIRLRLAELQAAGMVGKSGHYALLAGMNGRAPSGSLASGVYLIRVVGYTSIDDRNPTRRILLENRLHKVGIHKHSD